MDWGAKFSSAWVAVGDQMNWERGLENGIWGIVPALKRSWDKLAAGDLILFYCKAPVSRFFGAGILRGKFKQTVPLWKEELQAKEVIWPYRFEFDIIHLLGVNKWPKEGIANKGFNFPVLGGLNPVKDAAKAIRLVEFLGTKARPELLQKKAVAEKIFQIGQMQRMVVESKYKIDRFDLDVIWKRTIRSVPTYAFSVNLRGTLDDSLFALKHAHDIWNSRPFLITEPNRIPEVKGAVSGVYHEFSSSLKVLTSKQIDDLYTAKRNYYFLEDEYGLR